MRFNFNFSRGEQDPFVNTIQSFDPIAKGKIFIRGNNGAQINSLLEKARR